MTNPRVVPDLLKMAEDSNGPRRYLNSVNCAQNLSHQLNQRWQMEREEVSLRFDEGMAWCDPAVENLRGSSESWALIARLAQADDMYMK